MNTLVYQIQKKISHDLIVKKIPLLTWNEMMYIKKILVVCCCLFFSFCRAQSFPDHPITLVVPNPPGGFVDTSARLLSEPLARMINQPVVIDNRPGASGNTAYQFVARAKPDGYTLLISYSGYHIGNPSLMDKLPWDPIKDFKPVALLTTSTNLIAVHPSCYEFKGFHRIRKS